MSGAGQHVLAARVLGAGAGESGAGVLGQRYVGGGNSVANAITMGRVAGMTMGREIKARVAQTEQQVAAAL